MKVIYVVAVCALIGLLCWLYVGIIWWTIENAEILLKHHYGICYTKLLPFMSYNEIHTSLTALIAITFPLVVVYVRAQEPEATTLDEHMAYAPEKTCKENPAS